MHVYRTLIYSTLTNKGFLYLAKQSQKIRSFDPLTYFHFFVESNFIRLSQKEALMPTLQSIWLFEIIAVKDFYKYPKN
jgi:hypothetical protein